MNAMLAENWWLVLAALLIGVLVAWWIFASNRKTTVTRDDAPEVGEPGKAQRNQALIDSPREPLAGTPAKSAAAAETIAPSVAGMGGIGAAVQAATSDTPEIEAPAQPAEPSEPAAQPSPVASPPVAPAETADDLTAIKGLGPRIAARLAEAGITSLSQIAAWSDAEVEDWDERMNFKGRIVRDRWIDQARLLSSGDTAAYEAAFGKL